MTSFSFDPWLFGLECLIGVFLLFLIKPLFPLREISRPFFWWGVSTLLVFFLLSHAYIFTLSIAPFGFDQGIYRYDLLKSLESLPDVSTGLFFGFPLVTNVLLLLGWSVDQILSVFYLGCSLLLGITLLIVARQRWGYRAALWSLLLFSLSLVQWRAYEMMLFKQILALSFVLFSLWLLEKRSLFVLLPLLFLATLEPLDAFLVGVAFVIFSLISFRDHRQKSYFLRLLGFGGIGFGVLAWLQPGIWWDAWSLFSSGIFSPESLEYSIRNGVFFGGSEYGLKGGLIVLLGLLGWIFTVRREGVNVFVVYGGVLMGWILSGLFFWQRLFLQLDLLLILFAGVFLTTFLHQVRWKKTMTASLVVIFLIPFALMIRSFQPTVSEAELLSIQSFCAELDVGEVVMATDGVYGPWLRGYCPQQRVMAPGLFEYDPWTEEEWIRFWSSGEQAQEELLKNIQYPFFAYIGKKQVAVTLPSSWFEPLGEGWYALR